MNAGADESLEVFKAFGKGLYDHDAKTQSILVIFRSDRGLMGSAEKCRTV